MIERQLVSSGAPWEARVGYSRAVRVGDHLAIAGTTAVGDDGELVGPGDAYAQARRCLEIIAAALAEAGSCPEDVVRTRMYVTRIDDWEAVGRAHGEMFASIRPASTLVGVARLIDPAMLVEIEVDAIIGSAGGNAAPAS
jgi:enamine deaminase RidA (YjgF/YER057c/UK114 family)